MRKLFAIMLLSLGLVGCQSEADRKTDLDNAQKAFADTVASVNYDLDTKYFATLITTVGNDQGESVGMKLLLDCQQRGYQVHVGINGLPDVGDASHANPPLSNRLKAECDGIINTENRIQSRRKAREAAEEKRKDAAYDRSHKQSTAEATK
jgi:hypothetical protein